MNDFEKSTDPNDNVREVSIADRIKRFRSNPKKEEPSDLLTQSFNRVFNPKRGQELDDTFIDNVGEGIEQGWKGMASGVATFGAEIGSYFTRDDKWSDELKEWAVDYKESAPAGDDSVGQFIGSLIPSTVPTAAAIIAPPLAPLALTSLTTSSVGSGMMEYDEYNKSKGREGSDLKRLGVGVAYGAAEFIGERFALSKFLPKGAKGKLLMKGSPELAEKAGRDILQQYAGKNPKKASTLIKKVLQGSQVEGGQEAFTELMQGITDDVFKDREDGKSINDYLENMALAYAGGALMGTGLGTLSYGAQNKANRTRRQAQGQVILGKLKSTGDAVELIQRETSKKVGEPFEYTAMTPEGKIIKVAESDIDETVTLKPDQFQSLLQDKFDQESFNTKQKADREQEAKTQAEAVADAYVDSIIQRDEAGNERIEVATYNNENVVIAGRASESGIVYVTDMQGQNKRAVNEKQLVDIEELDPDEVYDQVVESQLGKKNATLNPSNPIQRGEVIPMENGTKGIIRGVNLETDEVTVEVTDAEGNEVVTETFSIDEVEEMRVPQTLDAEANTNFNEEGEIEASEEPTEQFERRELTIKQGKKERALDIAFFENGDAEVILKDLTEEDAQRLASSINKEYPKLNFQVEDRTGDDAFSKADFRIVMKNKANELPDAKYTRNGEEITKDEAEELIVRGDLEGLSIENDSKLQNELVRANKYKGKAEAQSVAGKDRTTQEAKLVELVNRFNEGDESIQGDAELIAEELKYGLTKTRGGQLQVIDRKSGQQIKINNPESTKGYLNHFFSNKFVKVNPDGPNEELSELEYKKVNAIIDKGIKNGLTPEEIYQKLRNSGYSKGMIEARHVYEWLQDRVDGGTNLKAGQKLNKSNNAAEQQEVQPEGQDDGAMASNSRARNLGGIMGETDPNAVQDGAREATDVQNAAGTEGTGIKDSDRSNIEKNQGSTEEQQAEQSPTDQTAESQPSDQISDEEVQSKVSSFLQKARDEFNGNGSNPFVNIAGIGVRKNELKNLFNEIERGEDTERARKVQQALEQYAQSGFIELKHSASVGRQFINETENVPFDEWLENGFIDQAPTPEQGALIDEAIEQFTDELGNIKWQEVQNQLNADEEFFTIFPYSLTQEQLQNLKEQANENIQNNQQTEETSGNEETGQELQEQQKRPKVRKYYDAFKENGAPLEEDPVSGRMRRLGDMKQHGDKSDETGRQIRWGVELDNGQKVSLDGALRITQPEQWAKRQEFYKSLRGAEKQLAMLSDLMTHQDMVDMAYDLFQDMQERGLETTMTEGKNQRIYKEEGHPFHILGTRKIKTSDNQEFRLEQALVNWSDNDFNTYGLKPRQLNETNPEQTPQNERGQEARSDRKESQAKAETKKLSEVAKEQQEEAKPKKASELLKGKVQVEPFKTGEGHTKGVFKDAKGNLYKSVETMMWDTSNPKKVTRKPSGQNSKEFEILQELQDLPNVVKIGKLVETSEGPAFEMESLDEIEKGDLTLSDYLKIEDTIKELNEKRGVSYSDHLLVMRRKSDGEPVLADFSNANKVGVEISSTTFKDDITYRTRELLSPEDEQLLVLREASDTIEFHKGLWPEDFVRNENEFEYLLTQRPPSIGTHPTGQIKDAEPVELGSGRQAYKITYNKPLSKEELEKYEMIPNYGMPDHGKIFEDSFGGKPIYYIVRNVSNDEVDVEEISQIERKTKRFKEKKSFREFYNFIKDMKEVSLDDLQNKIKKQSKPKTQKQRVADLVKDGPKSIKEVSEATGILEPNVRRILGQGAKDGTFERVDKGVYVLKTKDGKEHAWIEAGEAQEVLPRLVKEGKKFDMIFLDPSYFSKALIGGNRKPITYDFIDAQQFKKVADASAQLLREDDSHLYLMLSGAKGARKDMQNYLWMMDDAKLKVVGEGEYKKTYKDGKGVIGPNGKEMAAERLFLFTRSGSARKGDIPTNLKFRMVRPSIKDSYATEKPKEMLEALIKQSTLEGESVLDPFAGSGVTAAEALKANRKVTTVEKDPKVVENVIKPRIEKDVLAKPKEKIEDFGEHILGAAKDTYTRKAKTLSEITDEELLTKPMSKTLPEPNYEKLVEDGLLNENSAIVLKFARGLIGRKPKSRYRASRWLKDAKWLKQFYEEVYSGHYGKDSVSSFTKDGKTTLIDLSATPESYLFKINRNQFDTFLAIQQKAGFPKEYLDIKDFSISQPTYTYRSKTLGSTFDTEELANKAMKLAELDKKQGEVYQRSDGKWKIRYDASGEKAVIISKGPRIVDEYRTFQEAYEGLFNILKNKKNTPKKVKFSVYQNRSTKEIFIAKEQGKQQLKLKGGFESVKDARIFIDANYEALVEQLERLTQIPQTRKAKNRERLGADHLQGENVTPEKFEETFGFRGVQFGNWVNNQERQLALNDAYNAFVDLATILNIPTQALSLDGELAMAFGARGKAGANAHYEPGQVVINLTKKNGAGSLAHEWWHAFDNYLSKKRNEDEYLTERPVQYRVRKDGKYEQDLRIRPELIEAFAELDKAIKNTDIKARSKKLDVRKVKTYWSTGREISARAFEAYTIKRLNDQEYYNDYLANVVSPEEFFDPAMFTEEGKEVDVYPYPKGEEVESISKAFDGIFDVLESQKNADGSVALFKRTTTAAQEQSVPENKVSNSFNLFTQINRKQVEKHVNAVKAKYKNADIKVYDSIFDFMAEFPDQNIENPWEIPGLYFQDSVYVFANHPNNTSVNAIETLALHELVGHKGLRGWFTENRGDKKAFNSLMDDIHDAYKDNDGYIRLAQEYYGKPVADLTENERRVISEELIAHEAEKNLDASLVDKLIGQFKRLIKKITGKRPTLSDADIRFIIGNSRDYMGVGNSFISKARLKRVKDQLGLFGATPENAQLTKRNKIKEQMRTAEKELKRLQKLQSQYKSKTRATEIRDLQKEIIRLNEQLDKTLSYDDATRGGEQQSLFKRQAETPQFKAWFGDSKVVDENGEPLVVYHGTYENFNVFEPGHNKRPYSPVKYEYYFTDDPEISSRYAGSEDANPFLGGNNMPVYLSIKNPMTIDYKGDDWGALKQDIEKAKANNHDGLIVKNVSDIGGVQNLFIALNPTQIKSATGNNGQFDANNPDIRFKRGGDIRFSIIGPNGAKRSQFLNNALVRAQDLEKLGISQADIWNSTGWVRGLDGEWKYDLFEEELQFREPFPEIAKQLKNTPEGKDFNVKLGELYDFENLYKLYPSLKDLTVTFTDKLQDDSTIAAFGQLKGFEGKRIFFNKQKIQARGGDSANADRQDQGVGERTTRGARRLQASPQKYFLDFLHELQHAIQDLEPKFSKGTSPDTVFNVLEQEFKKKNKRNLKPEERQMLIVEAVDKYQAAMGEIEARAAERRAKLSPQTRRERSLAIDLQKENISQADPFPVFKRVPTFYSNSLHALGSIAQPKGTPEQFKSMLLKNGAIQAELDWLGFDEQFNSQKSITKEDVQQFLTENQIQVEQVLNSSIPDKAYVTRDQAIEMLDNDQAVYGIDDQQNESLIETIDDLDRFERYVPDEIFEVDTQNAMGEYTGTTKYSEYQLPGGQNYKELLLTLPTKAQRLSVHFDGETYLLKDSYGRIIKSGLSREEAIKESKKSSSNDVQNFNSSHWDEPNILSHIRFNERIDANGDKVLFLEELQSDWQQQGKKEGFNVRKRHYNKKNTKLYESENSDVFGLIDTETNEDIINQLRYNYEGVEPDFIQQDLIERINNSELNSRGVPNMPFKQTPQWVSLSLRRMIRYAAENGFDRIAWTTGEQQAERYDLSKQIDSIDVQKIPNQEGRKEVKIRKNQQNLETFAIEENGVIYAAENPTFDGKNLEDVIGKEMASKVISNNKESVVFSGLDLQVGGEGMKAFYNSILPNTAKKVLKKLDKEAKIEVMNFANDLAFEKWFKENRNSEDPTWSEFQNLNPKEQKEFRDAYEGELLDSKYPTKQLSFPITPAIRHTAIESGQPLFMRRPQVVNEPTKYGRTHDNFLRQWQDRFIDLKRVQDGIVKAGGYLDEKSNAYTKENLSHGKINQANRRFEIDKVRPLITHLKELNKIGLNFREVNNYLQAKHAPERFEYLSQRKQNEGKVMKDLTGWDSIEAENLINSFEQKAGVQRVDKLHTLVQDINKFILDEQVKSGIMDGARYGKLKKMYANYVPLRGFEEVEYDPTVFTGDESAQGRKSKAAEPIPYLLAMAQTAITKSEQNRVKQSLLEFVKANPDSRVYKIKNTTLVEWTLKDGTKRTKEFDYKPTKEEIGTGKIVTSVDPQSKYELINKFKEEDLSVMVRGRRVMITFREPQIARAFKKADTTTLPNFLQKFAGYTRWLGSMYTQYSPEFILRNFVRDLTTGLINLRTDHGEKTAAKVMAGTVSGKSMKALKQYLHNDKAEGTWGKYAKEFVDNGAMTGYSDLKDVQTFQKELIAEVEGLAGGERGAVTLNGIKNILKPIDHLNRLVENAVRLSAFKTLREKGMGVEEVAIYSKDLTVNFNRKGNASSFVGSFYLFFNATIQGSERILRPFGDKKTRARAIQAAVALPMLSVFLGIANRIIGGSDEDDEYYYDKLPDYTRQHNLLLPNILSDKEGDFIQIPLPYGFNIFFAFPDHAVRALMGKEKIGEAAINTMSVALESFSPFGAPDLTNEGTEWYDNVLRMASPTAAIPVVDLVQNRNFAGNPIFREPFSNSETPRPDSQRYFQNVNPAIRAVTEFLNDKTGGDDIQPGAIDINPEWIEHLTGQFGGGLATFFMNLTATAGTAIEGNNPFSFEDDRVRKVPFVRNYIKSVSSGYNQQKYFQIRNEIQDAEQLYNRYLKARDGEGARKFRREHMHLFRFSNMLDSYENRISKLRDRRKTLIQLKGKKSPEIKRIDNSLNDIYLKFNTQFDKVNNSEKKNLLSNIL